MQHSASEVGLEAAPLAPLCAHKALPELAGAEFREVTLSPSANGTTGEYAGQYNCPLGP